MSTSSASVDLANRFHSDIRSSFRRIAVSQRNFFKINISCLQGAKHLYLKWHLASKHYVCFIPIAHSVLFYRWNVSNLYDMCVFSTVVPLYNYISVLLLDQCDIKSKKRFPQSNYRYICHDYIFGIQMKNCKLFYIGTVYFYVCKLLNLGVHMLSI